MALLAHLLLLLATYLSSAEYASLKVRFVMTLAADHKTADKKFELTTTLKNTQFFFKVTSAEPEENKFSGDVGFKVFAKDTSDKGAEKDTKYGGKVQVTGKELRDPNIRCMIFDVEGRDGFITSYTATRWYISQLNKLKTVEDALDAINKEIIKEVCCQWSAAKGDTTKKAPECANYGKGETSASTQGNVDLKGIEH